MSQCVAGGCHSAWLGEVTVRGWGRSPWAVLACGARPSSPAHSSGLTAMPLPAPSPTSSVVCSASVLQASHRGLGCGFPGPRQVALA